MNKIVRSKSKKKGNFLATISLMRNRKGWIQIVEAFVAVLLVAGVLLIVLSRPSPKTDLSNRIYYAELSILREVQTDDTLRAEIINAAEPMPVEWNDARFPTGLKNKITVRTPDYLDCIGKICNMTQTCITDEVEGKDIYAQAITITSTLQELGYRKLNLFCWTK